MCRQDYFIYANIRKAYLMAYFNMNNNMAKFQENCRTNKYNHTHELEKSKIFYLLFNSLNYIKTL